MGISIWNKFQRHKPFIQAQITIRKKFTIIKHTYRYLFLKSFLADKGYAKMAYKSVNCSRDNLDDLWSRRKRLYIKFLVSNRWF